MVAVGIPTHSPKTVLTVSETDIGGGFVIVNIAVFEDRWPSIVPQ